jgi:hypothetical protein
MTKALLVDPANRTVEEVEYEGYKEIQRLLGCRCFALVPSFMAEEEKWKNVTAYCDDEGLFKDRLSFMRLPFYPEPVAGKVLVSGPTDEEGDDTDRTVSAEELRVAVVWLGTCPL